MSTSIIIQNYAEKLYPQKRGTFWGKYPQKRGTFWGKIGYLLGQNRVPFGASRFCNTLVYRYLQGYLFLIIIEPATQNFEILGAASHLIAAR